MGRTKIFLFFSILKKQYGTTAISQTHAPLAWICHGKGRRKFTWQQGWWYL